MATALMPQPEERKDWEKAKDWLQNVVLQRHIHTIDVRNFNKIKTEWHLYLYLKDGTNLCKILAKLAKNSGSITSSLVNATGKVPQLEEKNVKLFLDSVKKETKISHLFGREKEKALRDPKNFHRVLVGLSKLSKHYDGEVKSFDVKKDKSKLQVLVDDAVDFYENVVSNHETEEGDDYEEIEDEYDASADYDEYYKEPDIESYYVSNNDIISLLESINELTVTNSKQIKKLETLNTYRRENDLQILEKQFFKSFRINELMKIHTDLEIDFEMLKISYREIGNIMKKYQNRFLVYAYISAALGPTTYFLKDQMTYNDEVRNHVNTLEDNARKNKMANDNDVIKLTDISESIPLILISFKRIIDEKVIKFAKKEGKKVVEREAVKARDILENLNKHQDQFVKDYQYIETMENLMKEMDTGRERIRKLHEFGTFRRQIENIELQMLTAKKNTWMTVNLMLFNHYIVVIRTDLLDTEELLNMDDDIGTQCIELFKDKPLPYKKQYYHHFNMRKINFMPTGEDKIYRFLELKVFSEEGMGKVINEGSARIRIKKTDQKFFDELQDEIETMIKGATMKVEQIGKHSNCRGYKTKKEIHKIEDHKKCGECNGFLLGKIPLGYACSCGKVFHKECYFSPNKSIESDDIPEISTEPNNVVELKKLSEIDNAFQTKEEAQISLTNKPHGTFLLRFNEEKNQYSVSVIDTKTDPKKIKYRHHVIKNQTIREKEYFWIEQGEAAPSLLELIKSHQKSLNLLIPIRSRTLNLDPNEMQGYSSDEDDDIYENRDDVLDQSNDNGAASALRQNITNECFHGDISREDAEYKLGGHEPGTFLIRNNNGQYKITRVPTLGNKANFVIQKNDKGLYYVEKNGRTFESVMDLVRHLQSLDPSAKYWIGTPLTKSANFY